MVSVPVPFLAIIVIMSDWAIKLSARWNLYPLYRAAPKKATATTLTAMANGLQNAEVLRVPFICFSIIRKFRAFAFSKAGIQAETYADSISRKRLENSLSVSRSEIISDLSLSLI